ncbi:MAG: hypothetical protein SNJ85_04425 [Cyanobacteriota bacterium]
MATLNIYVPEDLKERMSKVEANWSEICRKAIVQELQRLEEAQSPSPSKPLKAKEWVCELLDPSPDIDGKKAIVKYLTHKQKDSVVTLEQFTKSLEKNLQDIYINFAEVYWRELLIANYPVEILFPGRDWLRGNLKFKYEFYLKYPKPESPSPKKDESEVELALAGLEELRKNINNSESK